MSDQLDELRAQLFEKADEASEAIVRNVMERPTALANALGNIEFEFELPEVNQTAQVTKVHATASELIGILSAALLVQHKQQNRAQVVRTFIAKVNGKDCDCEE